MKAQIKIKGKIHNVVLKCFNSDSSFLTVHLCTFRLTFYCILLRD